MRRKWIEDALEGTGWTYEEAMEGVSKGDFHLFEVEGGCMLGEFVVSPRSTAFHVWAAGGDVNAGGLSAIASLIPMAEAFARRHGCDTGYATGERWVRFLGKFGYKQSTPAVEKEL